MIYTSNKGRGIINTRGPMFYSRWHLAVFVFLFTFIFTFFYTQGLYFDSLAQDDIYVLDYISSTDTWSIANDMFFSSINPTSAYDFLHGRPLRPLLVKIIYHFAGPNPAVYFIINTIILSLLAVMIFLMLYGHFKTPWCVLAPMFLVTLPMVGISMTILHLTDVLVEFFIALTFCVFLYSYFTKKKSLGQIILFNVLLFLITLFALKTKPNSITIIPIIIIFLVVTKPRRLLEYAPFIVAPIFYVYKVFLVSNNLSLRQIIINFFYVLFKNPQTGFGTEPLSLISPFAIFFNMPGSLFGTLGFTLGWMFLILLIYYIYKFLKGRKYHLNADKEKFIFFVFVWLAVEVFFISTGYISTVIRYLIWSLVPFTMLVFTIFFEFFNNKVIKSAFLIIMVLLIVVNMGHTLYAVRGAVMGKNIAVHGAFDRLSEDLFGSSDFQTVSDFRIDKKPIKPMEIMEVNLFVQGANNDFNDLNISRAKEKASVHGVCYILFFGAKGIDMGYLGDNKTRATFLGSFSQCNKSLYCDMKRFFGLTLNDEKIFLYKLTPFVNQSYAINDAV